MHRSAVACWFVQTPDPRTVRVTVVVVTWRAPAPLDACLASLRAQTLPHRVLVVDNASDAETQEVLARHPQVQVLRNTANLGFAGGADQGLRAADTEYVALLNDDAVAEPGWLAALVQAADADPTTAAVTSLLLLGTGAGDAAETVNNAGVVVLPSWYGADRLAGAPRDAAAAAVDVFGFSGGAALLRRRPAVEVGGFPREFFLYYEDTDLSWRLNLAGWRIRYQPSAVVHHRHATSSDVRSASFAFHNERNRLLMLARCAPLPVALAATGRFLLTTVSIALRHGAARTGPHNLRAGLRVRVLLAVAGRLPAAARRRRAIRGGRRAEADLSLGR